MYSGSVNLLLGPAYALLRRQFVNFQVNPRPTATIGSNVLLAMGGSDPQHVTESIVGALGGRDALCVRVILGSSNANRKENCADKDQFANVEYLSDVRDMPIHMDWADLAIVAPGVTLWELLFMGVPTLCWPRYPEDSELAYELERTGAVMVLPRDLEPGKVGFLVDELADDHARRQRMSNAGRQLVDGRGAARVVSAIAQVARANARSEKARAH
jgi:spore coat polysaccharide biosynthesis predicted glycosyltransferase SpsG